MNKRPRRESAAGPSRQRRQAAATARRRPATTRRRAGDNAAARLAEGERLFRDFVELTPFRFRPFVRSFDSFDEYERWRRAQTDPWYR